MNITRLSRTANAQHNKPANRRARRNADAVLRIAPPAISGEAFTGNESSQLASVHRSVQRLGSAATVTDGGDATSGPEATALQGISKFEGHDAEGLALYSNVDLS